MKDYPYANRKQSQLLIDLTQVNSLRALAALHTMEARKQNVKTVLVHVKSSSFWQQQQGITRDSDSSSISNSDGSYGGKFPDEEPLLDPKTLLGVFTILGSFSNMSSLTIELEDRTLPMQALIVALEGAKNLKELSLKHVNISDDERGPELQNVLANHSNLEHVLLDHVRSTCAVQAFMTQLKTLRKLELVGSKISTVGTVTAEALVSACQLPRLKSIRLDDVPDVDGEHIEALATVLRSCPDQTSLQEFHLTSFGLGEAAGEAIATLIRTTSFLRAVTLHLGYWSQCGSTVAKVLAVNTSLTSLNLLVTGRRQISIDSKMVAIFRALEHNSKSSCLKELQLCQSCSGSRVETTLNSKVVESLEQMLDTNHSLETVLLMDDCFQQYPLSYSISSKLDQNRAGLSCLLYSDNDINDMANFHRDYVQAIIQGRDNLNVIFVALSNNPMLFDNCANDEDARDQEADDSPTLVSPEYVVSTTSRANSPSRHYPKLSTSFAKKVMNRSTANSQILRRLRSSWKQPTRR